LRSRIATQTTSTDNDHSAPTRPSQAIEWDLVWQHVDWQTADVSSDKSMSCISVMQLADEPAIP
jgi:hypothetical protein